MKTIVLLFTGLLMSLTTVTASEIKSDKQGNYLDITKRYRYAQPIVFVERGVEFLIFPDGSFDFNTNFEDSFYNNYYYKTRGFKRNTINSTYGTSLKCIKYTSYRHKNRGVSISHDRDGKVRRIGNVFLNYDRYGKIKRAGSVYMNYSYGRHSALTQVGGLRVKYNQWGKIIYTRGQVNGFNNNCNTNDEYYDYEDWYNDDDHLYFKRNNKTKKYKKGKR